MIQIPPAISPGIGLAALHPLNTPAIISQGSGRHTWCPENFLPNLLNRFPEEDAWLKMS
jgi:hypothetical protein